MDLMRAAISEQREEASRLGELNSQHAPVDQEELKRLQELHDAALPEHDALKLEQPHLRRQIMYIRSEIEDSEAAVGTLRETVDRLEEQSRQRGLALSELSAQISSSQDEQRQASESTAKLDERLHSLELKISDLATDKKRLLEQIVLASTKKAELDHLSRKKHGKGSRK